MRNHMLQRRQRGELHRSYRSCSERDMSHARTRPHKPAGSAHLEREARPGARATATLERPRRNEREGAGEARSRLRVWLQDGGWAATGQHDRIYRALRFQISKVMLECSLWNTTSAETTLRLRAMDLLRKRTTVSVSWWG